ncbi:MAG: SDR family oxidoreductase [Gammaproteobacteria bacterium PRO9]|nr:SDR family oxidoreductase [Gammaproteobacteria bacterium PRO9]
MTTDTTSPNVVVITGASKGIGAELAIQLAKPGTVLVLAARDAGLLEAVADLCRERGATVDTLPTDVTVEGECKAMVEQTIARHGRLDTLINNAGATMWARFDEITDLKMLERIMQVNFMGAVYCTAYALPHLKASHGRIVGIGSLTSLTGVPTRTGYAASKHAMRGFFDSLRIELEGTGVTVTMVYPGFVATGIRENAAGPDGKPVKMDPVMPESAMAVEDCVRQIVVAVRRRSRELVMPRVGRLTQWVKLISPALVDRIARRAVEHR